MTSKRTIGFLLYPRFEILDVCGPLEMFGVLKDHFRVVTVADTPVELTRLEFDLLHRLLINPGRVLTRERLLEQAWGYDYVGDTRAVDSAVKRLRAKLRAVSPEADCIESVRGIGYRINTVPQIGLASDDERKKPAGR